MANRRYLRQPGQVKRSLGGGGGGVVGNPPNQTRSAVYLDMRMSERKNVMLDLTTKLDFLIFDNKFNDQLLSLLQI